MNTETQELLSKIMSLAYEVNETTEHDVFVRFSGHVKKIDIEWILGGWRHSNKKNERVVEGCNINGTIHIENIPMLRKAVDTLSELLGKEKTNA